MPTLSTEADKNAVTAKERLESGRRKIVLQTTTCSLGQAEVFQTSFTKCKSGNTGFVTN